MMYGRASLIDLYLTTKFHRDQRSKNFEGRIQILLQVQSHTMQKLGH